MRGTGRDVREGLRAESKYEWGHGPRTENLDSLSATQSYTSEDVSMIGRAGDPSDLMYFGKVGRGCRFRIRIRITYTFTSDRDLN